MPERSGVPNIADQHLRPRSSEGQAVPQPKYHLQHLRSFADRETGPRSAEARRGPRSPQAELYRGPHDVTMANHFRSSGALLRQLAAAFLIARSPVTRDL